MSVVENWDLDRVIGQLIVVSVGHHADGGYGFSDRTENIGQIITDHHCGGICYFPVGDDGSSPDKIRDVVETLRRASDTPLLVTIDQEGGLVARMRDGATRFPSAMGQMASGLVTDIARASGTELHAVGIDQTFAPVADVNSEPRNPVIGIRSASSDPDRVATYVLEAKAGFDEAGVATCVKHFPGHGNTVTDSHFGLPVLDASREEWEATEAIPFTAAIAAGIDSVMIGHLHAPHLDPTPGPATFSRAIVTDLLRHELGFTGVIVTDALDMAGASEGMDPGEVCVRALEAGIDQLLMPRDPVGCMAAIRQAVECGRLCEADLRASAQRIMDLKARCGLFDESQRPEFATHDRLATRVMRRCLTWRDNQRFRLDHGLVDIIADPLPPSVGRGVENVPGELASILGAHGFDVEVHELGSRRAGSQAVLVTRDAWRFADIADSVAAQDVDVHMCARSPYDSSLQPEVPCLLAYGDIPGVARAVADSLISGVGLGRLPIDLPKGADIVSSRPAPSPAIRPATSADRAALGRICIRTGASGQDATGMYTDDEILPYIYAYPYLEYAPDLVRVIDVDGEVCGYILGVDDVEAFTSWWHEHWAPVLTQRFGDLDLDDASRALLDRGLNPDVPEWRAEYPAEFHIDILPVLHGQGWGTRLISEFVSLLSAPRLAIGVGAANVGARAFYERLGMTEVEVWRRNGEIGGYILGMEVA